MSCGLPREVLKWILSLDLSYAVKNPKRDFANGFLYAEILSRYYPADVQMHSFENVASMERKKANWALLEKLIKRKRIPVERSQIEAVMAAEGDTAIEVLQAVFNFIHSPSYEASKTAAAATTGPSPECISPSQHRDRTYDASTSGQPDFIPMPSQYEQQQQQHMYGQMALANFGGGAAAAGGPPGGGGVLAAPALQSPSMYPLTPEMAQQQQSYPGMSPQHQQSYSGMLDQQQQPYAGVLQQQQGSSYGMYPAAAMQLQQQQQDYTAMQGGNYGYTVQQQGQINAQAPVGSRVGGGGVGGGSGYGIQPQRTPGRSVSPGTTGSHSASSQPTPAPQSDGTQVAAAAGGGYAAAYALAYAEQMRQQAAAANYTLDQQALVYQQALYQYQLQAAAMANGALGGGAKAGGSQESPEREGLPYSRKPRPVDFKPYDMKAFEDKEYNVKAGRAYWQLGKLGPDLETEELQAKREAKERIKKMAEQVREENARKAVSRQKQRFPEAVAGGGGGVSSPAPAGGRDKDKELSARDRALQFAKNIPKPEPKPQKKKLSATQSGEAAAEAPAMSELELLERQHQERQQEVDKIRAELARIL